MITFNVPDKGVTNEAVSNTHLYSPPLPHGKFRHARITPKLPNLAVQENCQRRRLLVRITGIGQRCLYYSRSNIQICSVLIALFNVVSASVVMALLVTLVIIVVAAIAVGVVMEVAVVNKVV